VHLCATLSAGCDWRRHNMHGRSLTPPMRRQKMNTWGVLTVQPHIPSGGSFQALRLAGGDEATTQRLLDELG
jgi:hypothetical protein